MKFKKLFLCPITSIALVSVAQAGPIDPPPTTDLITPAPISLADDSWVPMLQAGTKELSINGAFDWEGGSSDLQWNLGASFGYFIKDGWEIGIAGAFSDRGNNETFGLGLFTEYNFNRDSQWVPFIGASFGWARSEFDVPRLVLDDDYYLKFDDKSDSWAATATIGIKYFFRPNIAVFAAGVFTWAGDDLFATDLADDFDDYRTSIVIGMRFYF